MLAALNGLLAKACEPAPVVELRLPTLEDSFPEQWEWITCEDRLTCVMTGRQAGKTSSSVLRMVLLAASRPGWKQLWLTLTRKNAKKYAFHPVIRELTERRIPFKVNRTDLRIELANGSIIEITSAEDHGSSQKVRGDNWHDVYIDETQAYADDVLTDLVEHVIFPLLMTRGGRLHLLGTPPDSVVGYFVKRADAPGWRWFNWSIFDNRFVPRAQVEAVIRDLGLVEGSNQYQREILGLPVKDPTKLVFEYDEAINSYEPGSVDFSLPGWRFVAGLDLGWSDLTSLHIAGWRSDDREQKLFEVYNWTMKNATLDDIAAEVASARKLYHPRRWVGDNGGHGATTILETIQKRISGIEFQKKPGNGELIPSIGLVNTDLRTGRIKLIKGGPTAEDTGKVVWSWNGNNKREPNKKGFHSDRLDSFRYAHHASRHFLAKAPPKQLTEREQWLERIEAPDAPNNGEW